MTENIQLARNTILQTLAKVVSIALGWFIVVLMTNYLGASGFGSYTIMVAYLQFFGVAADLGMVLVSSQLLAERESDKDRVFSNLLTFRLATAIGILVLAPFFIWLFPYSDVVKEGVVILSLSFFLIALLQIFTGLFQAMLKMGRAMLAELFGRVVLLAVLVVATLQGYGLLFVVWGVVLGSLANVLLAVILAQSFVKLRLSYDRELWQIIWKRSWPIALGIFFNLIYLKADTLILSFVRDEFEVGVYGAMYRVLEVLITFPTMFASLLLPLLAKRWIDNNQVGFTELAQQSFNMIIYLALPLMIGIWFTAPQVVALFGNDFMQMGVPLLRWLSFATAIIFIGTLLGHVIVAMDKQRSVLWVYATTAGLSLAVYGWAVPKFGAYGAVVSTVAMETLVLVLLFIFVRQHFSLRLQTKTILSVLVALLPMIIFLHYVSPAGLYFTVPVSIILYVGTLYLTGGVSPVFIKQILMRN
jgi:O-antigen/teichoic acid export membrane protein